MELDLTEDSHARIVDVEGPIQPGIHIRLLLLAALLLSALALTLGVDLGSEGAGRTVSLDPLVCFYGLNSLLPLEGKPVQHKHLGSQKDTSDLAVVQSNTEEVQSAAPVHGRSGHVEREAGDGGIHENAEVVT